MSANAVLAPTQTTFRAANVLRLLLIVVVVFTPTAVTFGLANILNITPIDAAPTISDEILYWHQVATFREVGFNGGYYTINEVPAPAEFSHFFTKGPLFPAIYGTLGRIIGWNLSMALVFNLIFVTLALAVFVAVIKPTTTQLLVALPLVATFWPLMLNIPLVMQEAFQCAVAIALAGLFYIAIKQGPNLSRKRRWLFVLIIVAASLVKGITLAVLLVPLLLVTLLIVVHLLLWPKFRETYAERHLPPESDINFEITTFENTMNQYVHYDAGESNAWCNTMPMSSFHQIQQRVIGVPAGIGLSSFRALDRLEYPIKSRYVLMDHTRVDTTGYPLNLDVLAETDIGTLYLNRDANCD